MADEEKLCMHSICNYCFLYEMKNGEIEINAKAFFPTYFSRAYNADDEIITYLSGRNMEVTCEQIGAKNLGRGLNKCVIQ